MFPVGGAGVGLLILRVCAAAMLDNPTFRSTVTLHLWAVATLIAINISLCVGAFTPIGCIASGFAQIAMPFCNIDRDLYDLAFSLGVTSALVLLGPGAFSVDCRLFGRRLILPSGSQ